MKAFIRSAAVKQRVYKSGDKVIPRAGGIDDRNRQRGKREGFPRKIRKTAVRTGTYRPAKYSPAKPAAATGRVAIKLFPPVAFNLYNTKHAI